jgi:hypothetical protein
MGKGRSGLAGRILSNVRAFSGSRTVWLMR